MLYWGYKKHLIPRFTYDTCDTIPLKSASYVGQVFLDTRILNCDALIVMRTSTRVLDELYTRKMIFTNPNIGTTIILRMGLQTVHRGLRAAGLGFVVIENGWKLWKNEMYIVKNIK